MKAFLSFFTFLLFLQIQTSFAQGSAGSQAEIEPRYLIDLPSAGALRKGTYNIDSRLEPGGGLTTAINVALADKFSFGISYGGRNVIGYGDPGWYKNPGINVRYRVYEETTEMPAMVLGLDLQGYGGWVDSTSRYVTKSPGLFLVASKNFEILGYLVLTGGMNYSLENKDGDKDLNFYLGLEKTVNDEISVVAEYNAAFNDNDASAFGKNRGYLNAGIKWSVGAGLTLELDFRNLNDNHKFLEPGGRTVRLEYTNFF